MTPVTFNDCFGWLHAPGDDVAGDVGVVICPGLMRDGLLAYCSLRLLADELAAAGYWVLRFDYPGTGDSCDGAIEREGGHWPAWMKSVDQAADWLRAQTGVRRLVLCGLAAFLGLVFVFQDVAAQTGYKLGAGDKLRVVVFGEEDASGEYEVDATGSISARLLGRVQVKGLAVSEVEQLLIEQYRSRGYFRNPRIAIELINLRPFFILGEVEKRGSYPYINGLTVAQAVAVAGGYTYRASRSRITIQRSGAPKEEPVTEDAPVFPGDIIRVPERFF